MVPWLTYWIQLSWFHLVVYKSISEWNSEINIQRAMYTFTLRSPQFQPVCPKRNLLNFFPFGVLPAWFHSTQHAHHQLQMTFLIPCLPALSPWLTIKLNWWSLLDIQMPLFNHKHYTCVCSNQCQVQWWESTRLNELT